VDQGTLFICHVDTMISSTWFQQEHNTISVSHEKGWRPIILSCCLSECVSQKVQNPEDGSFRVRLIGTHYRSPIFFMPAGCRYSVFTPLILGFLQGPDLQFFDYPRFSFNIFFYCCLFLTSILSWQPKASFSKS